MAVNPPKCHKLHLRLYARHYDPDQVEVSHTLTLFGREKYKLILWLPGVPSIESLGPARCETERHWQADSYMNGFRSMQSTTLFRIDGSGRVSSVPVHTGQFCSGPYGSVLFRSVRDSSVPVHTGQFCSGPSVLPMFSVQTSQLARSRKSVFSSRWLGCVSVQMGYTCVPI